MNKQEQFPSGSIKLIAVNDIPVHEDNRPSLPMHRAVPDEELELNKLAEKIFNKPKQK